MTCAKAIHDSGPVEYTPNPYHADAAAWQFYKAGQYLDADRAIREALCSGLSEPLFQYHAGLIAYALGRKEEAARRVKHALVLNGGKPLPR